MTAAQTKSLSARKATRKTYTAAESLEISLRNNEVLQERIAHLEAELAEYKDGHPTIEHFKEVNERARRWERMAYQAREARDKSEAEAERLKQHPHLWVDFIDGSGTFCFFCHRLKERSGRESETPGGGTSPSGVSSSPPLLPKAENCIHGVCSGTWLRVSDNVELPCPCRRCHPATAEPAAPDTSGEASPTRVASPPDEPDRLFHNARWWIREDAFRALEAELRAARKERDG